MNVKDYIATGILEEYCLGLLTGDEQAMVLQICKLYPGVRKELTAIENAMEKMAAIRAIAPNSDLKGKILNSLGFAEPVTRFDLADLPMADASSDYNIWLATLKHLIPPQPAENFTNHVLRQNHNLVQMLVISKIDVPEETHEDLMESLFILKGQCKCTVGKNIFILGPGDFLEIPLHLPHNVKLVSPYVAAILQHQYL